MHTFFIRVHTIYLCALVQTNLIEMERGVGAKLMQYSPPKAEQKIQRTCALAQWNKISICVYFIHISAYEHMSGMCVELMLANINIFITAFVCG